MLAPLVAEAAGAEPDDVVAAIVARTLAWTHRLLFRDAFTRLLDGEDQHVVAADLHQQAARAYALLEGGLGRYGA